MERNQIKLFDDKKIHTVGDEEIQDYYFSIMDVIELLTESERPRKYWAYLKAKLKSEGRELSENI